MHCSSFVLEISMRFPSQRASNAEFRQSSQKLLSESQPFGGKSQHYDGIKCGSILAILCWPKPLRRRAFMKAHSGANKISIYRLSNKSAFHRFPFCSNRGSFSCSHKNQHHKVFIKEGLLYNPDRLPQLDVMGICRTPMKNILSDSLYLRLSHMANLSNLSGPWRCSCLVTCCCYHLIAKPGPLFTKR